MKLPKMILFDYGQTLLGEGEWDNLRGNAALLRHAVKNPRNVTAQDVAALADELFGKTCLPVRELDRELHEWQFDRLLYELLQVEFPFTAQEQERVFFENAMTIEPMPHIEELLELIREIGIRTGVVSNLISSGMELERRITMHFPAHKFEFIIASSEYGVRKPDPLIFQLALAKAGLPPEDIWFCGDHPRCDVEGSHAAGMQPVWYESLDLLDPRPDPTLTAPNCPHLYIRSWRELIEILKEPTCTTPT